MLLFLFYLIIIRRLIFIAIYLLLLFFRIVKIHQAFTLSLGLTNQRQGGYLLLLRRQPLRWYPFWPKAGGGAEAGIEIHFFFISLFPLFRS